mgnify:CR=1 FL=1
MFSKNNLIKNHSLLIEENGNYYVKLKNGNELFIPAGGYWGAYGHEDVGNYVVLPSNELNKKSFDYIFCYEGKYGNITQGSLLRSCGTPCRCCFTK